MNINDDIELIKGFIEKEESLIAFNDILNSIEWHKNLLSIDGQFHEIGRKMAYATDIATEYHYDKFILPGSTWTPSLLTLRDIVVAIIRKPFNSVLLNLYETGKDEIRWYSDKESQLGDEPFIACLNLGAGRTFHFRKKGEEKGEHLEIFVESGDLLLMKEKCQKNWVHAILKEKNINGARISLTFRMVFNGILDHGIKLVNIKNIPKEPYDIYIGRANSFLNLEGSKWGNPYHMENESARPRVLNNYEYHIRNNSELILALPELVGKTLGCYCVPKSCHGGILIKLYEEFYCNKK